MLIYKVLVLAKENNTITHTYVNMNNYNSKNCEFVKYFLINCINVRQYLNKPSEITKFS